MGFKPDTSWEKRSYIVTATLACSVKMESPSVCDIQLHVSGYEHRTRQVQGIAADRTTGPARRVRASKSPVTSGAGYATGPTADANLERKWLKNFISTTVRQNRYKRRGWGWGPATFRRSFFCYSSASKITSEGRATVTALIIGVITWKGDANSALSNT
jgi:hypothetical protein